MPGPLPRAGVLLATVSLLAALPLPLAGAAWASKVATDVPAEVSTGMPAEMGPAVVSRADRALAPVTVPFTFTAVDEGAGLGDGSTVLLDEHDSELEAGAAARALTVLAEDASGYWQLRIGLPRRSDPIAPGFYRVSDEPRSPQVSLVSDSDSCNEPTGSVDLRAFDWTRGTVDRLWLLYEVRCDGRDRSVFGEVRIGVEETVLRVAPSALRWPARTHAGEAGWTAPVQVSPGVGTDATVDSVVVRGPGRDAFGITLDECTGVDVGVSGCLVWVHFHPDSAAPRSAVLDVRSGADRVGVRLDGAAVPGVTGWQLTSDDGDYVGQGLSRDFSTATDSVTFAGTRHVVSSSVTTEDGETWTATFAAPAGQALSPGTYAHAGRYPFQDSGPALSVEADGRGCDAVSGRYTVLGIGHDPGGRLQRLELEFVQHCASGGPALSGRLTYRARADHVAPGPVMNAAATWDRHRVRVAWTAPDDAPVAGVSVRWYPGAGSPPRLPTAGMAGYAGEGSSVLLRRVPRVGATVAVFGYDPAGNVGAPVVLAVPAR